MAPLNCIITQHLRTEQKFILFPTGIFSGLIQKRESVSAAVIVDVDVRAEGGACTLRLEASKENRAMEKVKLEQLTLRPLSGPSDAQAPRPR